MMPGSLVRGVENLISGPPQVLSVRFILCFGHLASPGAILVNTSVVSWIGDVEG